MNKNFNEWYIDVSLAPQDGQIEKRVNVIEAYAKSVKTVDIINLVDLYFDNPTDEAFVELFAKKFIEKDPSFSVRFREELRLLAGATLVEVAETNSHYDSLSELLTLTQNGFHMPGSSGGILAAIAQQFDNDRINLRESIKLTSQEDIPSADAFKTYIEENAWDDNAPSELISVLNAFKKSIEELSDNVDSLSTQHSVYREDSQILWWMVSCWSNELECSLKVIEKATASLIIGKEVADMVCNYPGPYSIRGVLAHVLEGCKGKTSKVALTDLIEKGNREWMNKYHDHLNGQITKLLPLSSAIIRSNNTDTLDEWYPKYKREILRDGKDPAKFPVEYAWQMYLEALAIRCYNDLIAEEK